MNDLKRRLEDNNKKMGEEISTSMK